MVMARPFSYHKTGFIDMPHVDVYQGEDMLKDMLTFYLREQMPIPDRYLMIERVMTESPLYYASSRKLMRRHLTKQYDFLIDTVKDDMK